MSTEPLAEHDYGVDSDCICGRNFATVRGLREHITKSRLSDSRETQVAANGKAALRNLSEAFARIKAEEWRIFVAATGYDPEDPSEDDYGTCVREAVAQVRADERQKVAEEIVAAINDVADGIHPGTASAKIGLLAAIAVASTFRSEQHEGCDCTELCSMGPTCPGGILAGLPDSGCWRTKDQEEK